MLSIIHFYTSNKLQYEGSKKRSMAMMLLKKFIYTFPGFN